MNKVYHKRLRSIATMDKLKSNCHLQFLLKIPAIYEASDKVKPMKIITWNINGIRAALGKNALDWAFAQQPDFLCLQEVNLIRKKQ